MARQDILVVDGDLRSLRVMEVSLRKAGFLVTTALDGDEALQKIRINRPQLIISDTELPRLNGFDLLRQVKANPETAVIPFVFLTGEKSIDHKIRGLELGVEDYLTKPIYIKEIIIRIGILINRKERERVEQNVTAGFIGSLSDIGIVDVIQTAEMNRKTGILTCQGPQGRGMLFFKDGRVIDAELGRLRGEKAVYRLLLWNEGTFRMSFEEIDRPDTIRVNNQALIMEGMRRMDEWIHLMEQLPKPETRLDVDAAVLSEKLTEIPDEVDRILRLVDGQRSLIEVVDDSPEDEMKTLDVVSKLYFEGIIFDALKGPAAPRIPLLPEIGAGAQLPQSGDGGGQASAPGESNWAQSVFAEVAGRSGSAERPADAGFAAQDAAPVATAGPEVTAGTPAAETAPPTHTAAFGAVSQPMDAGDAPAESAPPAQIADAGASSSTVSPGGETPVEPSAGQAQDAAPPAARPAGEPPVETVTQVPTVPVVQTPGIDIPRVPRSERRELTDRADAETRADESLADGEMHTEALAEEQFVAAMTRHTAPHVKGMMLGKRARRSGAKSEGSRTWIVVVLLVLAAAAAAGAFAFKDRLFGAARPGGKAPVQAVTPSRPVTAPEPAGQPAPPPPKAAEDAPVPPPSAAKPATVEAAPPAPSQPAKEAAAEPPVKEPAPPPKAETAAGAPAHAAAKEAGYEELLSKGQALRAAGKNGAALRELRKAVAANTKGAEAHSLIGQILIEMDKAAEASKHLRSATAANPNDANSFFYLGTAYQIAGDAEKARKAYEKYLFLKPTGEFARDIRTILRDLK